MHLGKSAEHYSKVSHADILDRVDPNINGLIEADIEWENKSSQHHIIAYDDDNYPPLLKEVKGAPPVLFVYGSATQLRFPSLGVVGPRKPSHEGMKNSAHFSTYIAQQGVCIVSGLAYGIDRVAHESAATKAGKTIAVVGTGIEVTYPASHNYLVRKIVDNGGSVVSIFPRKTAPLPPHFPARNRIISGMSLGVLVIEAGSRSGAMITARCAIEQGREVFAIPGSIHNPLAKGTNGLIKQGANLTESYRDILEHLQPVYESYGMAIKPLLQQGENAGSAKVDMRDDRSGGKISSRITSIAGGGIGGGGVDGVAKVSGGVTKMAASSEASSNLPNLGPAAAEILNLLNRGSLSADEIAGLSQIPINAINSSLLDMELQGIVYQEKGVFKKSIH